MKKLLFVMALAIAAHLSFAQAVIGTRQSGDDDGNILQFMTADNVRAWWLGNGSLIVGDNADPYTSYARKVVLYQTDLYLYGESDLYMATGRRLYGGAYRGTPRGYIDIFEGGNGDFVAQAHRAMFLQPADDDNPVFIHYPVSQFPQSIDMLQVNGSVQANGYVAAISDVQTSNYNATNSDYTVLMDPGSGSLTVTLPGPTGSGEVSKGRIMVVKNVGTSTGTVSVVPTGALATIDGG